MSWLRDSIDRLATARRWSYHHDGHAAAEPTALAALALLAHGRAAAAQRPIDWLTRVQSADGTVGVTASEKSPCWPTALAVLAWRAWNDRGHRSPGDAQNRRAGLLSARAAHRGCIERAVRWMLTARGDTSEQSPLIGHDTTLAGWPWVLGTHSWLEPTAYSVLALKAAGLGSHARTREAVRLLVDRLLPSGGCNYGNTIVMGQELLPHVQPTGLVLLALAGEEIDDPQIERSLAYLERSLASTHAIPSLAFGLMGLAAFGRRPPAADGWLESAIRRKTPFGPRAYTDALVALAAAPLAIT